MLEIQKYLLSGKTLDELQKELGIKPTLHPTDTRVILNYDQIESPKTHLVVREARGLVLDRSDWSLVARGFSRFFNWGEVQDEMSLFDFSDFSVLEKVDGSLCLLYNHNGQWHANTRGSFALDTMPHQNFTWQDAFSRALGVASIKDLDGKLDTAYCYVCEFCSPYNKVVRRYAEPTMYLLTAFALEEEVSVQQVAQMPGASLFRLPQVYTYRSIEEIQSFLQEQAERDATFEGVVIRDKNNQRWKIKNPKYLALHALKGNGDDVFNPKHLLPFVLGGEESEFLQYFPEATEAFYKLKSKVQHEYTRVLEAWIDASDIAEQKDFALTIKGKTDFTSILFSTRKAHGPKARSKHLRAEWQDAAEQILKKLKNLN